MSITKQRSPEKETSCRDPCLAVSNTSQHTTATSSSTHTTLHRQTDQPEVREQRDNHKDHQKDHACRKMFILYGKERE